MCIFCCISAFSNVFGHLKHAAWKELNDFFTWVGEHIKIVTKCIVHIQSHFILNFKIQIHLYWKQFHRFISILSDIKCKTNHKQHCRNFYNHMAMISGINDNEVIFLNPSVDFKSVSIYHINMIWRWEVLPSRQTERFYIPPMLNMKVRLSKKVIIEQWN